MKVLFIGGVGDGEWIEIGDQYRPFQLPVPRSLDNWNWNEPIGTEASIETHLYNPVRLRNKESTEYVVYRYEDDNLNVIARLIQGYKKDEKKE